MAVGEKNGIQVVYDETVNWGSLPYVATLDQPRVNQFLLDNNIPQADIDRTIITLCQAPKDPFSGGVGNFRAKDLNMSFYTDALFEESKGRPSTSPNRTLLHESKYLIDQILRPDYTGRINELIEMGVGVSVTIGAVAIALTGTYGMLESFSANSQVAPQITKELTRQVAIYTSMTLLALAGFHYLDPIEISAHRFASKMNKMPQWQNMLTIEPRET